MHNPATLPARPRQFETLAEGERLIAEVKETLNALVQVVEEETVLVRKGYLAQAAKIEPKKAVLAGQYYATTQRLKANAKFLRANLPQQVGALSRRHDEFRAI